MKIVDENGKLFKKFNLVDTIIVLLLAIVIIAIGYKAISAAIAARQADQEAEVTEVYENSPHIVYDVICADIPKECAEAFEAQMDLPMSDRQLMSMGKALEGYITGCTIVPDDEEDENSLYTVYFKIEAVPVEKDGIFSVGTQEVRVGKSHIVKTYIIETSGWVYAMDTPEIIEEPEDTEESDDA